MKRSQVFRAIGAIVVTVLYAAGSPTPATQDKSSVKEEIEKLQGTWTHLSREEGGKQISGENKELKFVVTGDKWTLGSQSGTLKIVDATGTPKKLDFVITDGPNKGLTALAVYQIDGEVFKYCGSDKARPSALETKPGDGSYCSSFKRPKES